MRAGVGVGVGVVVFVVVVGVGWFWSWSGSPESPNLVWYEVFTGFVRQVSSGIRFS